MVWVVQGYYLTGYLKSRSHLSITYLFFILSHGGHYRDYAADDGALFAQRNATLWIKALIRCGFSFQNHLSQHGCHYTTLNGQINARFQSEFFRPKDLRDFADTSLGCRFHDGIRENSLLLG